MTTKVTLGNKTVEGLVREVQEWYERVRDVHQRMSKVKPESSAYQTCSRSSGSSSLGSN